MKHYFVCIGLGLLSVCSWAEGQADTVSVPAQSLEQVFLAAMDANPALLIARSQLEIGKARRSQATAQLLPQISASGNFSDNEQHFPNDFSIPDPDSEFDGEKYSLQLRQVLFNWQAFASRKRSSYVVDQKEAEYFDRLGLLLLDTSDRYFSVLAAEDKRALVVAEREATDQQLKQAESRYQRKLIKITDLYEVRARAAIIRADEIDADNELALAKESLWELSGEEIGALYRLDETAVFPKLAGDVDSWVERAITGNAVLQSRKFAVSAAQQTISEKKGAHYPTVTFVASRQKSDLGYENTSTPKRFITYYGVDVSVPIFTGGSNSAKVSEAYHLAQIAKSEQEQVRREVVKRTRTAYLSANSSLRRIDAAKIAVKAANESARAMAKGFEYGTVTLTDVLDSLRQEFSAQRDLQQAKYTYLQAMLSLKKEAGVVGKSDIEEINSWLIYPQ